MNSRSAVTTSNRLYCILYVICVVYTKYYNYVVHTSFVVHMRLPDDWRDAITMTNKKRKLHPMYSDSKYIVCLALCLQTKLIEILIIISHLILITLISLTYQIDYLRRISLP